MVKPFPEWTDEIVSDDEVIDLIRAVPTHYITTLFWVGGTGNWSDTAHWSLTSGGSPSVLIPGATTAVHFDGNSGTGNATVDQGFTILSLVMSGYNGTITITGQTVISGSASFTSVGASAITGGTLSIASGTVAAKHCTLTNNTATGGATFNADASCSDGAGNTGWNFPPFLSGFNHRKPIRYKTAFPTGNLTDYPKLFKIVADADIASELASGGGFAFTQTDGTTIMPQGGYPEDTILSSGTLLSRSKVPTLLTAAVTGDGMGYLYFDRTQTTNDDKPGVMDGNYALFMPLNQDPSGSAPQEFDWVTGTNLGTSQGSMTSGDLVPGQVGDGLDFNGSNQYIELGTVSTANKPCTFTAWLKPTDLSGVHTIYSTASNGGIQFRIETNGAIRFVKSNVADIGQSTAGVVTAATLNHVAGTYNTGGDFAFFANGSTAGSGNNDQTIAAFDGQLAKNGVGGTEWFPGILTEFTLSNVIRPSDWLAWGPIDDSANSDTFSLGGMESQSSGAYFGPCNIRAHA